MIPKLPFGRTGHLSTRTLFGAAALSRVSQKEADAALEVLLSYGVNHIDTAASYGDSEKRIGPWMKRHRQDFFLATKVEERTYDKAWDSIRRSLRLLQVEQVDLLQLHNVSDAETWETVMGAGGALSAVLEAQKQGLTRFIGITGHGVQIAELHLKALERAPFDSVLLPYNYPLMQNPKYAADFAKLAAVCQERTIAVQTIKSLCRRPWGDRPRVRATWYEPLEGRENIDRAIHWVMATQPQVFLNTVGDIHVLPDVLAAADRFDPTQPAPDMAALSTSLEMEPLFV